MEVYLEPHCSSLFIALLLYIEWQIGDMNYIITTGYGLKYFFLILRGILSLFRSQLKYLSYLPLILLQ